MFIDCYEFIYCLVAKQHEATLQEAALANEEVILCLSGTEPLRLTYRIT